MGHQIVSKQRVTDHGEVLTSEREVNAMLDLVKQETERIESRFLEPACGTGNFLAEVLERKLAAVRKRYRSQHGYERQAVIAVASLYGIDILKDNVDACRDRLFAIFDRRYTERFKAEADDRCRATVRFILARNIVWGDALTLRTVGDDPQPIVFAEWSMVPRDKLRRRDFRFKELIERRSMRDMPLFSDLGEGVFIPEPVAAPPERHYSEIADVD